MSLGHVIEVLSKALEEMKRINATAQPPMFEQAAMEWALDQLSDRFPGHYVRVTCEKLRFSCGQPEQRCEVYVSDVAMCDAPTFSMALKKLVEQYEKSLEGVDVLASAGEAVAKATEPSQAATEDARPRITDPKRVFHALLLTDAGMKAGSPLEQDADMLEKEVHGWTDDERADAFEWAALEHLYANDNDDVERVPCPPHVEKLRPQYGRS